MTSTPSSKVPAVAPMFGRQLWVLRDGSARLHVMNGNFFAWDMARARSWWTIVASDETRASYIRILHPAICEALDAKEHLMSLLREVELRQGYMCLKGAQPKELPAGIDTHTADEAVDSADAEVLAYLRQFIENFGTVV